MEQASGEEESDHPEPGNESPEFYNRQPNETNGAGAPRRRRRRGGRGRRGRGGSGAGQNENQSAPAASAEPIAPPAPVRIPPPAPQPPLVKTGSMDKHLVHDEPIDPEPPRRPRSYRDLDAIPDDLD
jgi:hypothetical protein